ncbi:MAG: hypothetical protein EHM62_08790 [Methylococcus sp.]|nr:MAG: hypothetical protein EHM62_08790 [Methylococcus sp.]
MKKQQFLKLTPIVLGLCWAWSGAGQADNSLGPNPYQAGFGFDLPQEASWGGWQRGSAGSLHAEWDIFKDNSHGKPDDRTAAPDLGKSGFTSAWLGWNAGTFISSTQNLYSFSVPEIIQINLAGSPAAGPIRLALQVESQGDGSLNPKYLRVNGLGPAVVSQTFKGIYPSSMGPSELIHQLAIWNFPQAPANYVIDFTAPQHTTIRQVAVDIGPSQGGGVVRPPQPVVLEKTRFFINLPAEDLGADLTSSLFAQKRQFFPQVWPSRQLGYTQTIAKVGEDRRVRQRLSGSIRALFHDTAGDNTPSNRVMIDIYHRDEIGDIKIAECELKPTQFKRWANVLIDGREQRLGTAVYKLDVESQTFEKQTAKNKLTKRVGQCDLDLLQDGIQPGVPVVQDGDYTVIRRAAR